jgi:ankyrin repeat protein
MKHLGRMLVLAAWLGWLGSAVAGEIHEAAATNNLARVRELLQANKQLANARDFGTTPLHEAAGAGHLEIVQLLVASGADINALNSSKLTPLKVAMGLGRDAVAKWLEQHGGLVTVPSALPKTNPPPAISLPPVSPVGPGRTGPPIVMPRSNPPPAIAPTSPPSPQTTPEPQWPGMSISPNPPSAPTPGQHVPPAVTPEPLWPGMTARPNPVTPNPLTPNPLVPNPVTPGRPAPTPPAASVMATSSVPEVTPATYPIHEAIEKGDADQVRNSLRAWPDLLEAQDEKGWTPLHVAAANGRKELAQYFLGLKANPHAKTKFGWQPIHLAASKGDAEIIGLLLSFGARANEKTSTDETPLHLAARGGHANAVRALLRAKAEPNTAERITLLTPLHLAVAADSPAVADLLLAAGANANAPDAHGETALALALDGQKDQLAALLRKYGAQDPGNKAPTAIEQSLIQFYRHLDQVLEAGTVSEKRKAILGLIPTKDDARRMFPRSGQPAMTLVEELAREARKAPERELSIPNREGAIEKLQTAPPTPYVELLQSRGFLAADLPLCTLIVKRQGRRTSADMYCFVNKHWVAVPPLIRILPDQL